MSKNIASEKNVNAQEEVTESTNEETSNVENDNNSTTSNEKSFTQEEVNDILSKRLSREQEKYSKKQRELEKDLEELKDSLSSYKKKEEEYAKQSEEIIQYRLAEKNNVDKSIFEFLRGETEEELQASIDSYLKSRGGNTQENVPPKKKKNNVNSYLKEEGVFEEGINSKEDILTNASKRMQNMY